MGILKRKGTMTEREKVFFFLKEKRSKREEKEGENGCGFFGWVGIQT